MLIKFKIKKNMLTLVEKLILKISNLSTFAYVGDANFGLPLFLPAIELKVYTLYIYCGIKINLIYEM
jgi:hypothetical protein